MKLGVGRRIAGIRIDSKSGGRISARNRITDLAGDRDRSNPGQRVGKITEPFAEINCRRVVIELLRADAFVTGATPFDADTNRHHKLMYWILENTIFERGVKVLKSVCAHPGWPPGRGKMGVS